MESFQNSILAKSLVRPTYDIIIEVCVDCFTTLHEVDTCNLHVINL